MNSVVQNPIVEVPVTSIIVSKANKRSFYDPEGMDSLLHSMSGRFGQLYPVLLHRIRPEKYELILGSRRLKAARKAQWPTIAATIMDDITEPEMIVLSLAENLQRQDMTPFEEAKAILELCKEHGMSPGEVAKKVNKPVSWVKGRLKLLSVPDQVQDLLCRDKVTMNHVGIIANLRTPRDQIKYAKIVAKEQLSEEDLTTLIHDEARQINTSQRERPASRKLFTPMRTALKVKKFSKFLQQKIRPQLALEGAEISEVKTALREVRDTISDMLRHSRKM